jgi:hypothetical protein
VISSLRTNLQKSCFSLLTVLLERLIGDGILVALVDVEMIGFDFVVAVVAGNDCLDENRSNKSLLGWAGAAGVATFVVGTLAAAEIDGIVTGFACVGVGVISSNSNMSML